MGPPNRMAPCCGEVSAIGRKQQTKTEKALPHASLGLERDDLLEMYRTMVLARMHDERAKIIQRQGKISFTVTGIGHEAAAVGAVWALDKDTDWFLPYYRDTGAVLALGMTPYELMLNEFAKRDDPNGGGRQMPKHYGCKRLRIISGSSPVGTQIPHAVGLALAARIRRERTVAWVAFGDGAVSTGDFHEGVNFAAIHKLPVIFFCENNLYAISVPFTKQSPVERVSERAAAYGIPGVSVDGNDVLEVYAAVREAAGRARAGEGPTLIEARTYRLDSHTTNDSGTYRPEDEVAGWREKDPLLRFGSYLTENGLCDSQTLEQIQEQARELVREMAAKAEAAEDPDPSTAHLHVYAEEEGLPR